jgi:predicted GNAT family N-acyltransferase
MNIEVVDLRTINEADARASAELLYAIWPKPGRTADTLAADMLRQRRDYDGPEPQHPRSLFVREGSRIIAHASIYPRTLGTSAGDLTVLALARVCTDPAARGRRLGKQVVRAAFDLVDQGVFPFALFQTKDTVRPFYEELGAVTVDNHFFNSQAKDPSVWPFWDPNIMRYPAKPGWPTGDIDLRGPGW